MIFISLMAFGAFCTAAQDVPAATATPTPAAVVAAPAALLVTLPRDTPVELIATREVSTANAKPGTPIKLQVRSAVLIGGLTVIPAGTPAWGEVVTASDAGGLGKSGKMTARLKHVQLGDVEIPLDGEISSKGRKGSVAGAVLSGGLMGLFHRGNNAKIKAGEVVSSFVAEEVVLDYSGAAVRRAPGTVATPAPAPGTR
ncbi:hypothetical protein J2W22_004294 [Sphingomonas kyeonggiensis]|uniref:hypothetical protein n=1 Tax=Sphingomonas kyeonggiensis TaxID=1268553 RepID=UPI00277F671E|nr:hypothetical protein [Sphingomonas kyeonggiensis]MDQ0252206.1 hypothetical protein [Sphingomonas kyeonggiensis]